MKFIDRKRLKDIIPNISEADLIKTFKEIGQYIGLIHHNNRIHGDITTSNILYSNTKQLYFIDFGLTDYSTNIEDYAVDLHLFKRVLISSHGEKSAMLFKAFTQGYINSKNVRGKEVIDQIENIELRGRYIPKEKRPQKEKKGKNHEY